MQARTQGIAVTAAVVLAGGIAGCGSPARSDSTAAQTPTPAQTVTVTAGPSSASTPTVTAGPPPAPTTTVTAVRTELVERDVVPAPAGAGYHLHRRASGAFGVFGQVGTLHPTTSQEFMLAVARAYADSGAYGGSTFLTGVYSPATGKTYDMNCSARPDGTVLCTGGNNAEVLLFR